ncbi:LysO family transporter [Tissierella sp. MSJ-40]|uniref:LysO family transporter n=1 Tax=Tissierella simiarum TaxID=2841534 RepID=A0ABS6EBQ7_9FIRM|nr:LysO family transporter [Tissierella simiarum]MBU5440217.1 LysO family transporter [Tissierella simiarum]
MGLRLLIYLVILSIGGIIGYRDKVSEGLKARLNTIQNICLLFLLFIMGIRIGIDEKVISTFFSIGLKATIISIFTVSFSILFVHLISKYIIVKEDKIES